MNRPLKCFAAAVSGWSAAPALRCFKALSPVTLYFALFFFTLTVRGQVDWPDSRMVQSVSGQFIVTAVPQPSPFLHRPDLAADTNLVRLEPALLAVSAERFKLSLWSQLGFSAGSLWNGKIFLTLYPAGSLNDNVNINIGPLLGNVWNYHVEMPDVVTRTRYARALTATLLLEIANRGNRNPDHSAELPPWLTDGLARQVLGGESAKIVLSAPPKKLNGLSQSRINGDADSLDPLTEARHTLQDLPALDFDQLCWPTDAQMNGDDGGVYLASAQLFADSLLGLDHGAEKMRNLLAGLPGCMNWQTAFFVAFRQNFKRPLDVDKWWSLHVIRFAARAPGPHLTAAASRERLADLLSVPVEFRRNADSLPEHTVVSLQDAIQNFQPDQRSAILEIKKRDFELAQFRMAQPFASLAAAYRMAIIDFLGENRRSTGPVMTGRHNVSSSSGVSVEETVKKLDALDARCREVASKMDATEQSKTLNSAPP